MNYFFNILIFLMVLFLYIHIAAQLKTSEDLEIYEMDYTNNQNLQEICELKQPVLFDFKPISPTFYENITSDFIEEHASQDVIVKDIQDYDHVADSVDSIVLSAESATGLMKTDTRSRYFTENNHEFIEETSAYEQFYENDSLLKPMFSVVTKYDIMFGSDNTYTPLRYHTDSRRFISTQSGKIKVKMTPWKSTKYLYPNRDFHNYEFWSPVNIWKPNAKYRKELDKMKFLEFDVEPGYVLYIPSYWWYSIQFSEPDTLATSFQYNTIINCVSNARNLSLYFIQQNNTTTRVTKSIPIEPTHITGDNDSDPEDEISNEENKIPINT